MRSARADSNQPEIVAALRKAGATVQHLHTVGKGCPDILIGINGLNLLAEIKDGTKVKSARKLTPLETEWHETWRGQIAIIETVDDALQIIGVAK